MAPAPRYRTRSETGYWPQCPPPSPKQTSSELPLAGTAQEAHTLGSRPQSCPPVSILQLRSHLGGRCHSSSLPPAVLFPATSHLPTWLSDLLAYRQYVALTLPPTAAGTWPLVCLASHSEPTSGRPSLDAPWHHCKTPGKPTSRRHKRLQ